jgi:Arc/MetJ family transcription regulator
MRRGRGGRYLRNVTVTVTVTRGRSIFDARWLGVPAEAALKCVPELIGVHSMRTNIEIDDKLMKDALRATGAKTKKEAVELGLRTLLDLRAQEKARELRGKITWEGDLNVMRTDR